MTPQDRIIDPKEEISSRAKELRDGIFSLHTRRFGTVAELIIVEKYKLKKSNDQHHDATDEKGNRIEIKFSRLLKANKEPVNKNNLIKASIESATSKRALRYDEINKNKFDCNIQQVKRSEFDVIYYGIFFSDKVAVFSMTNEEVLNTPGYSDFQHKGNEGEGQFHLHNDSIEHHMKNNFREWITYDEIYKMFEQEKDNTL